MKVTSSNTQIQIYAKALRTFPHMPLILTMLPWKLNQLLQGTLLLNADYQTTMEKLAMPVLRKITFHFGLMFNLGR